MQGLKRSNSWQIAKCHDNLIQDKSKYVSIQCPVDVFLYNTAGDLVLAITDDAISTYTDEKIAVMVCGQEKSIVYPADSDYRIKIVASDGGTMDYAVTEVNGMLQTSVSVLAAEHAGNSQQIRELQEQKRTLFEHLVLHKLTEQYYQMKKAAIDNDLAQLKEVQTARSTQLSQRQADVKTKNANRELAQKVMDTGQLSSELVDALIERVYVYPGQEIEIVWKIAGFELSQSTVYKGLHKVTV